MRCSAPVVIVAAILLSTPALAQAPTGPRPVEPPFALMESTIREAKPGQQAAIEDFYLKLRAAEAKLNVPGLTDIYVLEHGGAGLRYRSFRSLRSWADLDKRLQDVTLDTLTRAYGEADAQHLVGALQAATESVTTGWPGHSRPQHVAQQRPGVAVYRSAAHPGQT